VIVIIGSGMAGLACARRLSDAALIVQFPVAHSLLLTGPGGRLPARLIPGPHGHTLATTSYATSWLILLKASFDAGAEVQSGGLGWMSLMARIRPVFPDMPTQGLFRPIRQPIYVAFALTLWTPPVWTPDQLALAISFTAYCVLAPRLKGRRFAARYSARFDSYRAEVPYMLSQLTAAKDHPDA